MKIGFYDQPTPLHIEVNDSKCSLGTGDGSSKKESFVLYKNDHKPAYYFWSKEDKNYLTNNQQRDGIL